MFLSRLKEEKSKKIENKKAKGMDENGSLEAKNRLPKR